VNDQPIPARVGRYRIEGVLGTGAMAVVYAGFDPGIERDVAIKCLHGEIAADPDFRRRFLIEARAAGHLTHPHIVTVFDTGATDDGRSYIAMERLSGESLASRVAREGFPDTPTIIELASQLASALDYAHARGVVHHDIKPENIMLEDGWHHAKIADFGIAERNSMRGATRGARRHIGGTPAYMAPERLRGKPCDARSDLFSLGVVLYWLVTGKLPWPAGDSLTDMIRERARAPRPPIEPRDPSVPSILISVIRTLLAAPLEVRYQRGAEVIDDLRLARREYERLHERPLATRIVSLRVRWAAILGAVLSLTLLIGLAAIYAKQNTAVTGLAVDYGSSLSRMVASESAENLLLGDRAATRALVQDISRNRQIHYLAIADRHGQVIASTRNSEVGHPLDAPPGEEHRAASGRIDSYRVPAGPGGQGDMLLFDVPIRYQTKTVGDLRLGISDAPLHAAQRATLWTIAIVLVLTLVAVIGAAFGLFRRLQVALDVLGDGLLRVARGDFHHRIRLVRRDELGRLFAAFNLMNSALDRRPVQHEPGEGEPEHDVTLPTQILDGDRNA
jgi:eukaryotic-like serine/threonine-protein kinase